LRIATLINPRKFSETGARPRTTRRLMYQALGLSQRNTNAYINPHDKAQQ